MNETKLTPRQRYLVNIINQSSGVTRLEIEKKTINIYPASKPTIARDISILLQNNLIQFKGRGRSISYFSIVTNPILKVFDLDQYFSIEPDRRIITNKNFNFSIFDYLINLFSKEEIYIFNKISRSFSEATKKLKSDIYKQELERFIIELSWKSSKIEGNTYSLLETESLIKQSIEARGHTKDEAMMILNHKQAFEQILKNREDFKIISISQIYQLHILLTKDLSITTGIREQAVGITGTPYKPLGNKWHLEEALVKLVGVLNQLENPLEKALAATSMISYIQPFSDGNKRTGRMLANAILVSHDCFPLSYRSVDETEYKKAMIIFYEQGSLYHLKEIFMDQYRFALDTYFVLDTPKI